MRLTTWVGRGGATGHKFAERALRAYDVFGWTFNWGINGGNGVASQFADTAAWRSRENSWSLIRLGIQSADCIAYPLLLSYIRQMKTLTVRLPDVLAKRIEEESLARRVSKSDIVRERLDQPGMPPSKESSLREILEAAWSAKLAVRPRQFRSPGKQRIAEAIRAKKLHH